MSLSKSVAGGFFYTEPIEADEDYQLFFKENNDGNLLEDQYTIADMTYKFLDIREDNRPIGKTVEVYFSESTEFSGDEFIDFLFVAIYEVEGKMCFDTRVYIRCDTGYEVDQQMAEYLNKKYYDAENTEYALLNGVFDEIREIYAKTEKEDYLKINETYTNEELLQMARNYCRKLGYNPEFYEIQEQDESIVQIWLYDIVKDDYSAKGVTRGRFNIVKETGLGENAITFEKIDFTKYY